MNLWQNQRPPSPNLHGHPKVSAFYERIISKCQVGVERMASPTLRLNLETLNVWTVRRMRVRKLTKYSTQKKLDFSARTVVPVCFDWSGPIRSAQRRGVAIRRVEDSAVEVELRTRNGSCGRTRFEKEHEQKRVAVIRQPRIGRQSVVRN